MDDFFCRTRSHAHPSIQFESFGNTIDTAARDRTTNVGLVYALLGDKITLYANEAHEEFPYVTPPFFGIDGSHAVLQAGSSFCVYSPLVFRDQLEEWSNYTLNYNGLDSNHTESILPGTILEFDEHGRTVPAKKDRPVYAPVWQTVPAPIDKRIFNLDLLTMTELANAIIPATTLGFPFFSNFLGDDGKKLVNFFTDESSIDDSVKLYDDTHIVLISPVFSHSGNNEKKRVAGILTVSGSFDDLFSNLLPEGSMPIVAHIASNRGLQASFKVEGPSSTYLGPIDAHDKKYSLLGREILRSDISLSDILPPGMDFTEYTITLFPTKELEDSYVNNLPWIMVGIVGGVFFSMIVTFVVYDGLVQKRNEMVTTAAARSEAVVSSMFPSTIRDKIYADIGQQNSSNGNTSKALNSFLSNLTGDLDVDDIGKFSTKPIADLFPETTVLFADLAGFTAWSSTREPSQVFILLETLYCAFDTLAKMRNIYKVETVGDCYVAVCGLPTSRKDHAVVMGRFAHDCLRKVKEVTRNLEVELGPDTTDLDIRVGMHSGPVTAGVLRGERSRFQLFGDTMNTASRMESTGIAGKIQISQDTARLLEKAGKAAWLQPRAELVHAKGKGNMETYWLIRHGSDDRTDSGSSTEYRVLEDELGNSQRVDGASRNGSMVKTLSIGKHNRLVKWNHDVLLRLIRQIVARRKLLSSISYDTESSPMGKETKSAAILEVEEIIRLPESRILANDLMECANDIKLDIEVQDQLHDLVSTIAALYHANPFHNFEHASHVTMSVTKLLSRIVAPSDLDESSLESLHDHTYGITSDPLTQFACVFSALIHDADHPGIPNSQLAKEKTPLATFYNNKSIAEQNSIDLAWGIFMSEGYKGLRRTICPTNEEQKRFRQLVVNSVIATDIMDKDLKTLRNKRWDDAFSTARSSEPLSDTVNRKATIVIEHLIQASDVAHTMQHWHVYRKWNERLFMEMLAAYEAGRSEKHPASFWYEGEIGFFDFYIIPLAKKLKSCGVFGVSSDEYLTYATRNRNEWELKGKEIVAEMMEKVGSVRPDEDE